MSEGSKTKGTGSGGPGFRKRLKQGKRRKQRHWQVTVFYKDGEKFARVYTEKDKAMKFAERKRESPKVKQARIIDLT